MVVRGRPQTFYYYMQLSSYRYIANANTGYNIRIILYYTIYNNTSVLILLLYTQQHTHPPSKKQGAAIERNPSPWPWLMPPDVARSARVHVRVYIIYHRLRDRDTKINTEDRGDETRQTANTHIIIKKENHATTHHTTTTTKKDSQTRTPFYLCIYI